MALTCALAALLLNVATAQSTTSAFWTYTSRLAEFATASPYTDFDGLVTTYTTTGWRTVESTVTPTATPTSVTSTAWSPYYNALDDLQNLQIIYAYYPVGAVAESDLLPDSATALEYATTTTTSIDFFMPVTLTAPASCPTKFTVTTSASVDVPDQVTDQVKPTSTVAGVTSTDRYGDVTYTQTWYLSAGAAPYTSTSDDNYYYYVAECRTPPASYATGSPGNGDTNYSDSSGNSCVYDSLACGTPLTYIIVLATVFPTLFLLGFLESWFWFRRLMLGKSAMRGGTVCWILISLLVLCFTRMQDKRSPEDQKLLQAQWKTMGSGKAFKAWLKWGWRHRYPEEYLGQYSRTTIGIVPTGLPLHAAMAQTVPGFPHAGPGQVGQVFYYGPPPPGWVPGPNGVLVPSQGSVYPPPQQAGFYGDLEKNRAVNSSSPVSALENTHSAVAPVTPQARQPANPASHSSVPQMPAPSPPPQAPLPPSSLHTPSPPPQLPPVETVSEAPASEASLPPHHAPNEPSPEHDPIDRSLYE